MARKEIDTGTYYGLNVKIVVEDDSVPTGTNTVPGMVFFRNDNEHSVKELEGQFKSILNIMPPSFRFDKIGAGDTKTANILVNVPKSTKPDSYGIKVEFSFKLCPPPVTSNALMVEVTHPIE